MEMEEKNPSFNNSFNINSTSTTKILTSPFSTATLVYDSYTATLSSKVKVDPNTKFISWLGGPTNESATLSIEINVTSAYYLSIQYICGDTNKPLKITFNNSNIGLIYTLPKTKSWSVNDATLFTIPVNLNSGINTIKFHGDGSNYCPDLGKIFLIFPPLTSDLSKGILLNNAKLELNDKLAGWIGGPSDGSVTAMVYSPFTSTYNLSFNYLCSDVSRPLVIDVNGVTTNTIITLPKTNGWTINDVKSFTISVPLLNGNNIIKFHGNGKDYAPSLSTLSINLINFNIPNFQKAVKTNGAKMLSSGAVGFIGGIFDGSVEVIYLSSQPGTYILTLVANGKNSPLLIKVNGINTDTIYNINSINSTPIEYNTELKLEYGINIITFHGNGIDYGPDLFSMSIKLAPLPAGISIFSFNMINSKLENGAFIDKDTNFVANIGGLDRGVATLTVTVPTAGLYELNVQYIENNSDKAMLIDVNDISTPPIYILPMKSYWVASDSTSFITTLTLLAGENKIKFYGIDDTVPLLGPVFLTNILPKTQNIKSLSITASANTQTVITYVATSGILNNGAKPFNNTNFVSLLGGPTDGSLTLEPYISTAGFYVIEFQYLSSGEELKLKVDVNNISSRTTYTPEATKDMQIENAKIFSIKTSLNFGTNTIVFHGNNNNFSPTIGQITLTYSNDAAIIYKTSEGILSGNAFVIGLTDMVRNIGGPLKGSVTVSVNVDKAGAYKMELQYAASDADRVLLLDLNGVHNQKTYTLPKSINWSITNVKVFSTYLSLKAGKNSIKFYGKGDNYAPSLGNFTLSFYTPPPKPPLPENSYYISESLLENGAAIDAETGFVSFLGGLLDGSATLSLKPKQGGIYVLTTEYISDGDQYPLLYDVDGKNTGLISVVKQTHGKPLKTTLIINLSKYRETKVKYHGDGTHLAPMLGTATLTLTFPFDFD